MHASQTFGLFRILLIASFGLLLLLQIRCSGGFDFQSTDDPSVDIRVDDLCKVYLVGQVIDARTLKEVAGATIRLDDTFAESDATGMYRIEVTHPEDLIEKIRAMSARKQGYEMDTYQFVPSDWVVPGLCEGSVSFVCVDFVMTPKKEPIVALPDVDNKFQVRDTSLFLTEQFGEGLQYDTLISILDVLIPAGAVNKPTPVCVTTYARSSYAGALPPGNSINLPIVRFRISTDPMIDFNMPFTVSLTSNHPVPYVPADPLDVYRYNSVDVPYKYYDFNSNYWKNVQDAQVGYHAPSQAIQVRSRKLGTYLVTNDSYSITMNEQFDQGDEVFVGALSNCDCGEAKYFTYQVTIDGGFQYGLKDPNGVPLAEQVIYMNDWKVMTNTPFSSLVTLQNSPGADQYNGFIPGPAKSFEDFALLQKCEQLSISYSPILQQAGGNQYGAPYAFLRPIGVQYHFASSVCPTSSACHQGCPK